MFFKKANPAFIACLMFAGLEIAAFAYSKPLENVTVQLKWYHQFQFAGYYAAVEKGFYRQAGLQVVLKEGKPGMIFTDEVISGRANFGVELPELLLDRNSGKPVVVLAAIFQHSPMILIAKAESAIHSPQDIAGHRLMNGNPEIKAMLLNEGVPIEKIQMVPHSWNFEDIVNDKVDAATGYFTDQPFYFQERGIPVRIFHPIHYGIDFYGDCLFTTEKEIERHPERVDKFRTASLKGWEYAMENQEEIIDLIITRYRSVSSREQLRYEAKTMHRLMLPQLIEIGHMNPGRWRHIADTYVTLGLLDENYSLTGFIYDPIVKPDYTAVKRVVRLLSVSVFLIATVAIVLYFFNRRLNNLVKERTLEISKANRELEEHRNHLEIMVSSRTEALKKEIQKHKDTAEALSLDESRLETLLNLSQMDDASIQEINDFCLEEAIRLTNSKIGYLAFLDDAEEVLTMYSWSRGAMLQCMVDEKPVCFRVDDTGLWGEAVRQRKPVITNEYQTYDPLKKGYPKGHVPIKRHMNIPVFERERIVAVAGVGNKSEDYDESDVRQLALLMRGMWRLNQRKKADAEKRKLEKRLYQAQKMEAIATLAGGIAHQFNNALSVIAGNADLLLMGLPENINVDDVTSQMKDSVQRMSQLTNQLLAYARGGKYQSKKISLCDLVNETLPLLAYVIKPTITVETDLPENILRVNADETQLQMVLSAILTNASEAIEGSGEVRITCRNLEISRDMMTEFPESRVGTYVKMTIEDNGSGMDEKIRRRVFEPFFTTKFQGRGLGMAAAYGIVNNHNGWIAVDSELGKGTVVQVCLPAIGEERK